jgi:RNase P subunit RPR2
VKKSITKTEAKNKIKLLFDEIKNKKPEEILKIKKLSMSYKIPLGENKKLFCKECYAVYENPKIRIKNKIKSITCEKCGYIKRWKINFS